MVASSHTIAVALVALLGALALCDPARAGIDELPGRVGACFVPQQDCEAEIVGRIRAAGQSIRVQAYGFSDPRLLAALAAAAGRGVDVQVIVDRSNLGRRRPVVDALSRQGIPIWVDDVTGIAHTKAIIIDRALVIGGSYNYTVAAQARNAETVIFLRGEQVAAPFLRNWDERRATAAPLPPPP